MKSIKIFMCLLIGFFCSASSCKDPQLVKKVYRIEVHNNTTSILNYLLSYNYPDTIIPNQYNNVKGIKAMDFTYEDSEKEWEKVFAEKNIDKMSFFFFSPDTITKYGWDTVRINYKILKRKEVTLQELQNNNYTVAYP